MLRRTSRAQQRSRRTRQASATGGHPLVKQLNDNFRELITVTRDQFMPSKRDRTPLPTPLRDTVYTFRRSCSLGNVSVGVTGAGDGISFQLSDLPNATDFTSLFDQYRFLEVRFKFVPTSAPFGPSTSATDFPKLMTVIDYDDATSPASADELRQYDTLQITPNTKAVERIIQPPRAALAAYSGAFTSYAESTLDQWFDCASDGIQFYGLKWYVPPISVVSGSYVLWTIECTYTMQFRRPR